MLVAVSEILELLNILEPAAFLPGNNWSELLSFAEAIALVHQEGCGLAFSIKGRAVL
jgi:hypothetical protein